MIVSNPLDSCRTVAILLSFSFCATSIASAQTYQIDASGTVISASGIWSAENGVGFDVSALIDLDEANAIDTIDLVDSTKYAFAAPPSTATFSAAGGSALGTITQSGVVFVEAVGDFDADANGNPFGITGIVDILLFDGGEYNVDCTGGTVDPVFGCDLPNAPKLSGTEFRLLIINSGDWFAGNALPSSIPDIGGLIGVYGEGDIWSADTSVGEVQMEFTSMTASVQAPAPVPALGPSAAVLLTGLLGFAMSRWRRI